MTPTDDLTPILKKLRLSGTLPTLELRTRQAIEDQLPYPEFLSARPVPTTATTASSDASPIPRC